MPKASTYFDVSGLEPIHDPAWFLATRGQKAAYLRACRELILTEWDRQTRAGLDASGRKMAPLKMATKLHRHSEMGRADPEAPPLQPARALSRTRSLVDARTVGLAVRVYWKFDPISGRRWGTILNYHRLGTGHLPVRNVFGLSEKARQRVLQAAFLWWAGYSRGQKVVMPVRPRPGKAARPPAAVQPNPHAREPAPGAKPFVPKGVDVSIGGDIYTGSRTAAAALLGAMKSGTFSGFRSYE